MVLVGQYDIPIVLASTSPRRQMLLNQVNISHQVLPVVIDEKILDQEIATDYIQRMVQQKAQQALLNLSKLTWQPSQTICLVITADTIGVLPSGEILSKPKNFDHAKAMWQQMSHQPHHIWTAVQVTIATLDQQRWQAMDQKSQIVKTLVEFVALTDEMMSAYWQSGEPQDKAGGYAIQGLGASFIKSIHGSYPNVVGLPLVETIQLLQQALTTLKETNFQPSLQDKESFLTNFDKP